MLKFDYSDGARCGGDVRTCDHTVADWILAAREDAADRKLTMAREEGHT
jgi:hypothetical protein